MDSKVFNEIIETLKQRYKIDEYPQHVSDSDPFKILIGAVLSHRTRDEMTDLAYNRLFKRYSSPADIARAPLRNIEKLIRPVGFYRQKAKWIKKIAGIISREKGGRVPERREELMALPGVGPKTADIVLSVGYGLPEVAVDTHVETVSKRLGIVSEEAGYEDIKKAINSLSTPENIRLVNMLFVKFGREICRKRRPRCMVCQLKKNCRYYNEVARGLIS